MSSPKTPFLQDILSAYFNQDWPEIFGTEDAVFEDMLAPENCTAQELDALCVEIEEVLAFYEESQLRALFESIGISFYPPGSGKSYSLWLNEVLVRLRNRLGKRDC